jgi:hypothetical protein
MKIRGWLMLAVALVAFFAGSHLIAALFFIASVAFFGVAERDAEKRTERAAQRAARAEERQELQQDGEEQREWDIFFQQWGTPHHDDEVRLKVYAAKQAITFQEARDEAWEHWCFTVHDPFQECRKDAKDRIKRLPEAVAIARAHGFTVELGSTEHWVAPWDGKIKWGEAHLPACKLSKGAQTRYYFPSAFVEFALGGCVPSKQEDTGAYPFNGPGQEQLARLFAEGKPKTEDDVKLENSMAETDALLAKAKS